MIRRILPLVLIVGAMVATACADLTAPTRELHPTSKKSDWVCRSGYQSESGFWVCTDSLLQ